jgi:glycerol-3-phosphate acyltransferase PlsY
MPLLVALLVILAAYLLGGVPWGLLLGRWLRGIDLREYGSGSTGATNAARTLGWRVSAAVFVLDLAKGAGAVVLARALTGDPLVEALAGVAAIAGHCWSPYIRFSGGRGVATGIGGALAIAPWTLLLMVPIGLITIALTRYVSLASLIGTLAVPVGIIVGVALGWLPAAAIVYGVAGAAIIVVMHRGNIQRLLAGTERRLGERVAAGGSAPAAKNSRAR